MKVALRLKEAMAARGLDAQTLAGQAGLTLDVAQRLFAGEPTEIDLPTLDRIAQVLGVLPNELVAEVEQPEPSVLDQGEPPRSSAVPTQDMDEIKKSGA